MTYTCRCLPIPCVFTAVIIAIRVRGDHCLPELLQPLAVSTQEEAVVGNLKLEVSVIPECMVMAWQEGRFPDSL